MGDIDTYRDLGEFPTQEERDARAVEAKEAQQRHPLTEAFISKLQALQHGYWMGRGQYGHPRHLRKDETYETPYGFGSFVKANRDALVTLTGKEDPTYEEYLRPFINGFFNADRIVQIADEEDLSYEQLVDFILYLDAVRDYRKQHEVKRTYSPKEIDQLREFARLANHITLDQGTINEMKRLATGLDELAAKKYTARYINQRLKQVMNRADKIDEEISRLSSDVRSAASAAECAIGKSDRLLSRIGSRDTSFSSRPKRGTGGYQGL